MFRTFSILTSFLLATGLSVSSSAQSPVSEIPILNLNPDKLVSVDGAIRSRQVSLTTESLSQAFDAHSPAETLQLNLFPGRTITLTQTRYSSEIDGSASWGGKVDGFANGFATLSYDEGRLMGQVQYDNELYRIVPGPDNTYTIAQINLAQLPMAGPRLPAPIKTKKNKEGPPAYSTQAWHPRIRVAFMFTPDALSQISVNSSTAQAEGKMIVALANDALANTALNQMDFKYVGARSTYCAAQVSGKTNEQLLQDISNPASCIGARAANLRNSANADAILLIKSSGSYPFYPENVCSTGWSDAFGDGSLAFGVVGLNCIPVHLATLELGNIIGLGDYRPADALPGDFGFGYFSNSTSNMTIMMTQTACPAAAFPCTRIPLFSNVHPNGFWFSERMGRGLWQSEPAINRKTLLNNWNTVAAYR